MNGAHTQAQLAQLTKVVEQLTKKVEKQGKEIAILKSKPAQVVRYEHGQGPCN
jgi:2-keto-3-deoxy-L-rhamnonate aldolase RhmA